MDKSMSCVDEGFRQRYLRFYCSYKQNSNTIPTFSVNPDRKRLTATHVDIDRRQKTKMTVGKPEVVITLFGTRSTWFHRVFPHFQCRPIECRVDRYTPTSTDVRKPKWRLEAESGHNSGLEQGIDAISTAVPYFRCLLIECRLEWHTATPNDAREQG
jgi:hypothetical protein